MEMQESLKHTVWDCKYHVVWIPKYRKKAVYGELRRELGEVFRELVKQKESKNQRQGKMRRLYGDTYNSRKRKIAGLTS